MEKAGYSNDVINTFDARGWLDNQAEPDAASITIEALAAMAGAPNNPDFVSELIDLESMDQATEEAVNQVNALVSQETGQPFSEYADYTADLAAHNQTRGMVLVAEHNALARKLGSTQILQSAARMRAQDIISNMPVSSLSPASYEAAERRNARDADEAFRRGKYAECLEAKRAQVLNHELARAALEAKDSYYRGSRMAMRAKRSQTLYKGYQFIIMKLLENHSVAQMTEEQRRMFNESGVNEDDRVNTIIDELREAGTPIEELSNYLYNTKHVRDMTVAEMEDFFMVIRQLEHLARAVQKQNLTRLAESVEQVVDEGRAQLEAAAKEQKRKEGKDNRVPITKKERAIDFLKNVFFLNHVKIQTWCRIFDRNKDGGFFWELFINSANKRAEFEAEYRAKISEGLRSILVPLFKKSVDEDPIRIAGFDRPFTHGMRLVVALNWGNASNRSRLQDGDPRFTTQAVNQILSTLTEEDWRAVERVWLLFESLRPMIAAKERRVFVVQPKCSEPAPFEVTTKEGKKLQLHGGYYPVKYDPRASSRADKNEAAESALDELKGAYQSTTTKRSFTKERVALVEDMPLRLDFVGIYEGFNDVIHDLAWHEWLIDTKRVLDGIPKLTDGLREDIRERYGYSVAKQIEEWRKDIALGGRMEGSDTARIVSALSRNIGMATMGYSATSAISQLTGIGYVLPRVGARALASGMRKWMANPSGLSEEVRSKSAFMAVRMNNQTKEIAEVRNMIEMGKINAIKAHAFDLLQFTQNIVDVIAWQSAYEKYTNAGVEEARAIELADQTVIDTQSSGHISDLSKIERDKGIMRPLTIFYSWANAALNLIVAEVLGEHNKAKAAASLLWYCGVMNVFDHFFREMLRPGDDDDDDETKSIMRESLGSIVEFGLGLFVVTREVANAAGTTVAGGKAMAYNGPAGLRLASDAVNVIKDLGNDPFTETAFKHYLSIAGSMTGLPSVQINRTIKGMEAIAEGKVDGQIDSARALLFGYDGRVQ